MGSASLLLFAVGLSLFNVAVMDPTEEALNFLDDLGNDHAELTLPATGSRASSSQKRQKSFNFRYKNYQLDGIRPAAIAICKKFYQLQILGITITQKNVARSVGCSKMEHVMNIDTTEGVMDAFTFVQAIGVIDLNQGRSAEDVQCSNQITRQFGRNYQDKIFKNRINFRRSVYYVCQTVHEATAMVPATDVSGFRHRGCVCASKLTNAFTSEDIDIYTIPITDLVVYDYLEEIWYMTAAGNDQVNIINSYNGDAWMQLAMSTGAFQYACWKLRSHGQGQGQRYQARLAACNVFFPSQ